MERKKTKGCNNLLRNSGKEYLNNQYTDWGKQKRNIKKKEKRNRAKGQKGRMQSKQGEDWSIPYPSSFHHAEFCTRFSAV